MKSYLFAIVLLYSTTSVFSQNLVPNSDFETHVPCASLTGDISHDAPPWHGPLNNSYTPYYNYCNAFYYYSVPHNLFNSLGFQYPHSGNAYCKVVVYADFQTNARYYIQTSLDSVLLAGKKYCVSFYVNLVNPAKYGINSIGAFFSATPVACSGIAELLNYVPQVENDSDKIILDTLNWTLISGDFIAQGNEQYITIGNFKNDSNILTALNDSNGAETDYYIDDVSVTLCDSTFGVKNLSLTHTIKLSPNPADESVFFSAEKFSTGLFVLSNLTGQTILEQNLSSNLQEISTAALKDGIYIYTFSTKNSTYTGKLSVIHK